MSVKAAKAVRDRTVASKDGKGASVDKPARVPRAKPAPVQGQQAAPKTKAKLFKIPTKIGECADLLYTTRQDRLALQKQVTELEDREKALKAHIIETVPKSSATGAAGKVARVQVVNQDEPVVQDWEEFYKHVKKKGEFDLLNRALNRTAVKARWDNDKQIPGVGHFTATKVSVTKV